MKTSRTHFSPTPYRHLFLFFIACFIHLTSLAQGPLTATVDPLCTTNCCSSSQPCNCTAGVLVTGGIPPYSYTVWSGTNPVGYAACVPNLCPGTYVFEIRDAQNNQIIFPVTVGLTCCTLNCADTTICFEIPDSSVVLLPPSYTKGGTGVGGGTGPANPDTCGYDSIWSNAPGIYPVGTTVVTWYVSRNGQVDSCMQNVIRNPPTVYAINFTTSPPIVAGVINICNGQSITFNDNSTGTTGRLWNFGNGFYSTNAVHTEPPANYPPGTYYDTLTVYDACGFAHDTAFVVIVDSASGPDIFCISVVCPGDTVTYHTNANCTTYNWSVIGGTFFPVPSSTSDSATVIWGAGPQGTISLSVSGCTPPLNCPFPTTKTVHIVPATMPIAGDTIVCAGSESCYEVECIPGNSHSWELMPANAGTVTGQGTCRICVQWAPGFFGPVTIQLNYQNVLTGAGCTLPGECTNDPGCGGVATITVDVRPIFGISGPAKVCPNAVSAPFNGMNTTNNTIAAGVSWKLVTPVPSIINFPNTAALNAYTWIAGPGIYKLTAYAPPNIYCNDSAVMNVEVVNMLVPNAISGPDTVCANVSTIYSVAPNMAGVTYVWNVIGGVIVGPANGSSVTIQWNPGGGTVSVVQMLSAAPFCASASSPVFNVTTWPNFPLPVVTSSNPIVCMNSTITYYIPTPLLSNATYTWSIVPATAGNILSANGTDSIVIKWISAAITPIFVKLKISRCYEDSVMVPINLLPLPTVPNITYFPANPCVNTPVNFSTLNPGPLWNWSFGDAGTSIVQNPTHIYTAAGNYNVQLYVTNASGCSDTATTAITVEDIPVVPVITGPDSVCINALASYGFSQPLFPGAYYSWSLSNSPKGIISSSGNNFMNLKWTVAGTDTVKVRVQANCLDTTIKYVVVISPLPTPGISVVSPACQNSNVNFTGSGGGTYSWSFAGGSPGFSSSPNPVVTYALPGNYNVSLTVVSAAGCAATATTTMSINPEPIAIINGPYSICSFPGSVTMNAVAQPGYTFLWSPTGTTGPSVTTTISSLTTFSCVVTNSFGCTKLSNAITVDTASCTTIIDSCQVNDSIDFTYTPPICLTQQYTKIYTGTLTGWNFGAGGSAGAVSPVSATYPYPGVFPVTVVGVALGTYPDGSPCNKNISRTRNVTIPFDPDFDFDYQCNGSNVMQVVFTNTSQYLGLATAYNWTWFDATYAATLSTNPFPPALTLAPGTHVINLSVFDPATGASCTITKTINVPLPIVASFTVSSPLCVGAPNTFTNTSVSLANQASMLFNNGNGGTATTSPASIPYAASGSYTASLAVTDIYGCTSSASQPVTVTPAGSGTITVGALACDSVSLTASGPGPFTWNVINPPPVPNNPAYVKTSGFYSVTGIGVNGCPYTAGPVQVTVNKSPQVTITGTTQYCQGEALNIKTSAAGVNYAWIRLPSTPVGGNSPNLNIIANTPGTFTYQVTVTAANGCTGSATYTINVDPVPGSAVIVASGPLTFCDGDSIKLSVTPPGFTYLWSKSPAPAIPSPQNANPDLWVTTSGTYSVIVQTANGCAYPAIAPVTVVVNPKPPVAITGNTTLCEGKTLTLQTTPVGGGTYLWIGPTGTGVTNPFVLANIQLADAGPYTVVVTNAFGCTATATVNVVVNPSPVPPIIVSNPGGVLCQGQMFNLSVSNPFGPPIVYNWSTGQMGTSINVVLPATYSVTATNQFGCKAPSNSITLHPRPDLSCVPSGCYEFCDECDSVNIPGPSGLFSYNWQVLVGNVFTFYSASQNLMVYPPGGKFRLMGANQWGCADSTDTLDIEFNNCCPLPDTTLCLDTCVNFNDNTLQGWQPFPGAPNVGLFVTNSGSQAGPTDFFVMASDLAGPSQLETGYNLRGKWCCGEFCFDYKVFDDGVAGVTNVNPTFRILNGSLGFVFTSSTVVNETMGWQNICAPITDCNPPPSSPAGVWTPIAGTTLSDWTTVLSNVTNVLFRVDFSAAVGEASGFDNVCINSNVPSIDAGNDTTVCAGSVISLHVEGCSNNPEWYAISGDTLIFVGNGPLIDVAPTQNTCYVVICCGVGACCCDTDTVCVNVNLLPILQWNTVYPSVCQNSAPIVLDSSQILVFVNNNWVPVSSLGGSGVFSGPFVTGNIFTPSTIGTYTICYTYTDSVGCSNQICNTINVIFCCDTSFQISAGNDTTICHGGVAVLTVSGCNGAATWYKMSGQGPIVIGQGPLVDVTPTQNTCYMVVCCDPLYPTCCDTDTVCVNVNQLPILQWNTVYPSVCQNSAPIVLDSSQILVFVNNNWVPVSSLGGSGVFSGPFVTGNIFTPSTIGTYTICYTYTDSVGCSNQICNTINVIFCCDTSFQISAGNDTTICHGGVAVLTVSGCNGAATWYKMSVQGPIVIGQGPLVDVTPTQNTCYMVVCCDPLYPACCDTDTVCVYVNELPILQWNTNYPSVCQNSAPIYLDSNNVLVFVNNNWVPVSSLGGSGVFSGPFVTGNIFTPSTIGTYTICYTYTDSVGCSNQICNTINVIFCCDTSFQISAGNDTTICHGGVAVLTVSGCNGAATWYKMSVQGPIVIGQGPLVDVTPTQNTCYMVVCCDPLYPACCDTDTVCVYVNELPILQWNTNYPSVCQNSAPIYLDSNNILVFVNNNWVPVSSLGGSGVFSGPFVIGNIFTPSTIGTYTICYTYTDSVGCSNQICNTINVIFCCDTSFQISAGNDTTICHGGVAVLNVSGCNGSAIWYALSPNGPVPVGQGPILDALPQTSTCYMVVCCDPLYPACCDTDTVCVYVNELPILQWNTNYPSVCQNSAPIYLDSNNVLVFVNNNWVPVSSLGGSGVFSGPFVTGNIFTPSTIGTYTICYTYTDSVGCSNQICNTINVIFCCDTSFQISAGNDTTICHGGVAVLNVSGCNGSAIWYALSPNGPVPVGQGPILDALPQTSTCYMVVCCDPLYPACCDTDTVCVYVNELPILQWNTNYPSVCQNSAPIYLDSNNVLVFVNNNWVPVSSLGGSGVFSGPFVTGNIFTPSTIGTYTICYTYTDSVGCSNQICNTINVIFCCDTSFQISAGNDTTICAGGVAILQVDGCMGTPTWYMLTGEGPIPVVQGQIFDVFPQVNTCYMVVCCDTMYPACCDTDTVCVFVNAPPVLTWPTVYPDVCQNGGSITLNPADIFVDVNNTWVMSPFAGGTGVFSGTGVVGNTFTPGAPGLYTICFTYTDSLGCSSTICNTINVIFCCDTLSTVSAGNDTTICAGGVAILTATGCAGTPTWHILTGEGPVPVVQGAIFDVFPQTSTCYMVICCDPLYPACCDTDTVCVFVNPLPVLSWPTIYTDICNNGGPITLNPADVFVDINNTWVMSPFAGGTGVFSGPGVFGNTFTPPGIGSYVITFTYTDANGCVTTISNSITVIFCCDTLSTVSAGNDTTICAGGVAILTATGCTGNTTWYQMGVEGPFVVGQGPVFDALPQQSTCYMVVCCDPLYPACCDTDTVCVFVNPLPVLSWPTIYTDICNNGGPITLNPADVFVDINNTWVMSPFAGGTGVFSGPGVFGNTFTPPGIGSYVITFTYTDANGCVATISNSITVIFCCDTLSTVSAGNDTTICAGGVAILTATGCTGNTTWYQMGVEGPFVVGQGPVFDALPQQSTCYMVVCCDPLYPACCDTDTVCVYVGSQPVLSWPSSYPEICQNGGPITLNPADIFVDINNTWVMSPFAGGTGVFSGTGVMGNTFTPGAPGLYTICFTFTNQAGCSSTICKTISVIYCCDAQINISAGNDTTICSGGVATLTVTGCSSLASWYRLTAGGPAFMGYGPFIEVGLQGNTVAVTACYMVVCCDPVYPQCCDTDTVCVTILPVVSVGPITGTHLTACLPAIFGGSTYSVPAVSGATYQWTVPAGMSISSGQGTPTITTTWTNLAMNVGISGQLCVYQITPCGVQLICTPIDLNAVAPVTPPSISGPAKVCPGNIVTYSVAAVARATSYNWTLPAGMTITSGAGTNVITVSVGPGFVGGTIVLTASNACGTSPARTKAVMLNPPLTPGPISGPSTGVCGTNGAVYTIVPVPNAVSYLWTVTNGTIVGANTGTSIVVNWNTSFTSAVVTVRAVNGCGMGAIRTLNVSGAPATPGPITGPVNVCSGATYHYSTATVAGASQYTWVTPGTIVSGQGTKDIDVVFNTVPAANQVVSVRASNPCGNSAIRVLNGITISFCIRMDNSDYDLLSVYPNPAHEQFEINYITMKDSEYRMDMIDAEGRVVWNMKGTGDGELLRKQVDVTGIARGLYLIRLNDEEGVKQLKIIIN